MRRFTVVLLTLVLLLTWSQATLAFGRFGPTDLMYVPTSGTLADGAYGLFGNFSDGLAVLGMDVGLVPNLELGVTAWVWDTSDSASLRLKYHLLTEKRDGFGLAVGIQDIGNGDISPYVVAGKTLAPTLQGYVGIGGGQIDGVMLGLSKEMKSMNGATLFLEYDSYTVNLGGRFRLSGGLGLDIGIVDLDWVVLGVNYVNRF